MEASMLVLAGATLLFFLPLLFYYTSGPKGKSQRLPLPPGPRGWPILGNLPQLGTKPHHSIAALARTYGPLFSLRLGRRNAVVATDSATASLFLKTHDANFASRPPLVGAQLLTYNFQDLVFAPYGSRWRMLRKICNTHLFSVKALANFQHVRSEEVSLLVQRLAGLNSAVQFSEELNVCVTNALARMVLGWRVFAPGTEAEEFKDMVMELMKVTGVSNVVDYVPELKWLDPQGIMGQLKRIHKRFDKLLDGLIAETAPGRNRSAEGSFMSMLVDLKNKEDVDGEGGKVTDFVIKGLLKDLFVAGTDTTTSTTEWALAELLRQPAVLHKLQQELDQVIGRDRLVSESDIPNLPYLQAVIKENFRLHPSTPLSLPHYSLESCEVAGYHIPKNTTLLVNVWAIGRDPATWTDPLEFRPDRFLPGGEHPDVDVRGNSFEAIPFGAGRRICIGMSLGLRMVQFLVATLVHGFDWELAGGATKEKLNMEEDFGLTLQRAEPLFLVPAKRLSPAAYTRT